MTTKQDALEVLKAQYRERIALRESEVRALRAKLALIEEIQEESESLVVSQIAGDKYVKAGMTEAVLDTMRTIATDTYIDAALVMKHLLSQSFKPHGKNFPVSVGTTLRRLADDGRLLTEKLDGRRLYKAKAAEK